MEVPLSGCLLQTQGRQRTKKKSWEGGSHCRKDCKVIISDISNVIRYFIFISMDMCWTESENVSCSVDSLWLHGLQPARLLCPWNSPGKNIGVRCHSLLQGIFPTPRSNPGLPHCRQILNHLSHKGSLRMLTVLVQFSHSVMSDSLSPDGLQHTWPPCPLPTPGIYSNSCPLSWWCHPTISSFVGPLPSHWLYSSNWFQRPENHKNQWCNF